MSRFIVRLKCRVLGHRWSSWEKVDGHLERECLRCGDVLAMYPPWASALVEGLTEIAEFYMGLEAGK